jgi:ubiquinone/menaquinone biosynthesis C-methylase UbiE
MRDEDGKRIKREELNKKFLENHKLYSEQLKFYRGFGYDLEKERDFILGKSLPIAGSILEIGTGKGHFALSLAKRGFYFTSIDISIQEQEIAKLNLRYFGLERQVDLRTEDARHLGFPDKSFNAILSVNAFHHIQNPSQVLNEIARLLKPPGKIVLSDFTEKGFDIINRCHAKEGKTHDYFRNSLGCAKDFFIYKGLDIQEFQSEVQTVLVASDIEDKK